MLSRPFLIIALSMFTATMGLGMVLPLLPVYAKSFGASGATIGLTVSAFAIDRIVGRVDLKADRKASALLVQASHVEPGQDEAEVAAALAAELTEVARWQGLERIEVRSRGNLARALRQEVR